MAPSKKIPKRLVMLQLAKVGLGCCCRFGSLLLSGSKLRGARAAFLHIVDTYSPMRRNMRPQTLDPKTLKP